MIEVVNRGSNYIELRDNDAAVLISYDTVVAVSINGILFKTDKFHSRTTSKHINLCGYKDAEEVPQEKLEEMVELTQGVMQ